MMRHVARNDERQGADGERIIAGDASAHPGLSRKILEKRDGCEACPLEFFDMRRPGNRVGLRAGSGNILIVTR